MGLVGGQIEEKVLETLKEIASKGFEKSAIEASLNSLEFRCDPDACAATSPVLNTMLPCIPELKKTFCADCANVSSSGVDSGATYLLRHGQY
eukprot:3372491-Rhodomonas_salina.1